MADQCVALRHSMADLRLVLEDDDNWRALSALLSVGEAAGGVTGYAWLARQDELRDALSGNPVYGLYCELDRALAFAARHSRSSDLSVSATGPVRPEAADPGFTADFKQEPRRERIAERIGSLAFLAENSAEAVPPPGSRADTAVADAGAAVLSPADAVSLAAKSILSRLAITSPAPHSAVAIELPAPIEPVEQSEVSPNEPAHLESLPEADLKVETIAADDAGAEDLLPRDVDAEAALPVSDGEDVSSDPVLDFENLEADEPGAYQDGFEDEFEAEVSIVQRGAPAPALAQAHCAETDPHAAGVASSAPTVEANTPEAHETPTLEERLQQLDRQSMSLIEPSKPSGLDSPGEEGAGPPASWLEIMRARRASAALTSASRFKLRASEAEWIPEASAVQDEPSIVDPEAARIEFADDTAEFQSVEAEVKIVQRKPRLPADRASRASGSIRDEAPLELPVRILGALEEASVEIIRQAKPARSANPTGHESAASRPGPGATPTRFSRALTGE